MRHLQGFCERARRTQSDRSTRARSVCAWLAPLVLTACLGPGTLNEDRCASTPQELFATQCNTCHAAALTGNARSDAPDGVNYDTDGDIQHQAAEIREQIDKDLMPPFRSLASCDKTMLFGYLSQLERQGCIAGCSGRACGDDGCGGSCGACPAGLACSPNGQCIETVCIPDCQGKACGDDGCGGSCGGCGDALACSAAGTCDCLPQCDGRSCGADGCGGVCGECPANELCSQDGSCSCVPSCDGQLCGDDGCGGTCGSCPPWETCAAANACECVPDCSGRECGPDACGGSCGTCRGVLVCNTHPGQCAMSCTVDCSGRECGDDNCGGSCGTCPDGAWCTREGTCECVPSCSGRACGDDGCGGSCGTCAGGLACNDAGQCGCEADCTGRECGSDGCGGSCGSCGAGVACSAAGTCTGCVPSCSGKTCGDDGCGSTCGACVAGQTCNAGSCEYGTVGFAADVFPLFQAAGCAGLMCHDSNRPSEGLELSSAGASYTAMVNVAAGQCSSRKLVVPGDADASYLMNKLTGVDMCSGSKMPKADLSLPVSELETIRAWIESGADP